MTQINADGLRATKKDVGGEKVYDKVQISIRLTSLPETQEQWQKFIGSLWRMERELKEGR